MKRLKKCKNMKVTNMTTIRFSKNIEQCFPLEIWHKAFCLMNVSLNITFLTGRIK